MLEFVRVQRFKTLLDASFQLSALNLFAGLNGMGKSSFIQTLLLVRQSFEKGTLPEQGLLLSGDYVSLGTGRDILSGQADTNTISFLFTWEGREPVRFEFDYSSDSDFQKIVTPVNLPGYRDLSLLNRNFQYLSADRIGPSVSYRVSDYHTTELNTLGNHGEYTVHYIATNEQKPLPILDLRHANATSDTMLDNIEGWMSALAPGIQVRAAVQPSLNVASLGYAFVHGKDKTAEFRPQNVGFGLTFALPVITSVLRARPGDLLIVENPEAHLHPAGQAVLGKLCALAASKGVQLIIETHSDHFLNGIRVAVRDGVLCPTQLRLYFLERDASDSNHATFVHNPQIDRSGRLDSWPTGFFDEWDRQLEKLL